MGPPGVMDLDSGAWAVVHAGQLWVCWTQAPNCWRRIEFESPQNILTHQLGDAPSELGEDFIDDVNTAPALGSGSAQSSPEQWRLGFWGARALWIELGDQRWRVDFGQQRARVTDDPAPLRLGRPQVYECGPAGDKPAIVSGRLGWQPAPRCGLGPNQSTCLAPPPARLRRPRALDLRLALQLSSTQAWTTHDDHAADLQVASVRSSAGFEFALVVDLGFDLGGARVQQRALAALQRRDRVRRLPSTLVGHDGSSAGVLPSIAAAEARALQVVLCGAAAQ